jgi:hypothetical protein
MEHLPREAAGSEWNQHWKKDVWAAAGRAIGEGLPKTFEVHLCHHVPQTSDMEYKDLMFANLDFSLALVLPLHSIPSFFPFGMRQLTLCLFHHCVLEACSMLLNFYRGSQPRVCLESQRRI